MCRALSEFHISGIESTIPFCQMVFCHPAFQKGTYSTHTLDVIIKESQKELTLHRADHILAARIGAVKKHQQESDEIKPMPQKESINQWTFAGRKDGIE